MQEEQTHVLVGATPRVFVGVYPSSHDIAHKRLKEGPYGAGRRAATNAG